MNAHSAPQATTDIQFSALDNVNVYWMEFARWLEKSPSGRVPDELLDEYRNALLVLAPRKPEQFAAAAEFIEESHRKFIRRSALPIPSPAQSAGGANGHSGNSAIPNDVTVLLLDSIGELASVYRLADGAFVGGSLVPSGGHNILEPAAFGKVPVFGPSMENFAEIASRFVAAGAAIQVESPEDVGVDCIASQSATHEGNER